MPAGPLPGRTHHRRDGPTPKDQGLRWAWRPQHRCAHLNPRPTPEGGGGRRGLPAAKHPFPRSPLPSLSLPSLLRASPGPCTPPLAHRAPSGVGRWGEKGKRPWAAWLTPCNKSDSVPEKGEGAENGFPARGFTFGGKRGPRRVAQEGPAQKPLCSPPAPHNHAERNYLFSKRLSGLAPGHVAGVAAPPRPRSRRASGRWRPRSQERAARWGRGSKTSRPAGGRAAVAPSCRCGD